MIIVPKRRLIVPVPSIWRFRDADYDRFSNPRRSAARCLSAVSGQNLGSNQNSGFGTTSCSISLPQNVPAGSLIIVNATETYTGGFAYPTISDTAGNSYTIITFGYPNGSSANGFGTFHYCANCSALSSGQHIIYQNHTGATSDIVVSACFFTGLTASPYNFSATGIASGAGTSISLASGTPTTTPTLFVVSTSTGGEGVGPGGILSSGTGWAPPPNFAALGNPVYSCAGANQLGGGAAVTYTGMWNNSVNWWAAVAAFTALPSVSAGFNMPMLGM